jgi:DNA-binding HxlR family transcriptional regulator
MEFTLMPARNVPTPGRPVRGSTTGRPIMAALDLLGRRWVLRILWELRDGPVGARGMLVRCEGLSSSVLYERLRDLGRAGIIEQTDDDAYVVSALGASLLTSLEPLVKWSATWERSTRPRR